METNKRIKYSVVALIISICMTILLYVNVNNTSLDYEKVSVTIVDIKVVKEKLLIKPNYLPDKEKYDITVAYKGKRYKLENVISSSYYSKGQPIIDAYYSNGKMYANIEGVKTATKQATWYFLSLGLVVLLFGNLIYQIKVKQIKESQTKRQ